MEVLYHLSLLHANWYLIQLQEVKDGFVER